jgi:hypothetical protein
MNMGNENTESGQVPGASGQPSQEASQVSGSTPSSVDVETLKTVLRPLIAEEVARNQQSTKDKRIAKLSGEMASVKTVLNRLEELMNEGFSQKQAVRLLEMEERQLLANRDSHQDEAEVPATGKTGTQTQAGSVDTATLVKQLGLDANSPEVLAAIRGSDDIASQLATLASLAVKKRAAQQATPNPAQIMTGGGGHSVPPTTTASLQREYEEANQKIPRGANAIQARVNLKGAIRKRAQEAGVESPV